MRTKIIVSLIVFVFCCGASPASHALECVTLFRPTSVELLWWKRVNVTGFNQLKREQIDILKEFYAIFAHRFTAFPDEVSLHILSEDQRLTDLLPFAVLKGMKIEDRVSSQRGTAWGKRLYDDSRGMRWGANVAVGIERFKTQRIGEKHNAVHELVHLLHDYSMSSAEKKQIEMLYAKAKLHGRFLDKYSALNAEEYFAEAVETFFAVERDHALVDKFYWNQTLDNLKKHDPEMLAFIIKLLKTSD